MSEEAKDKGVGWVASFMLIVNNVTGPGLVVMPLVFAGGGWVAGGAGLAICLLVSVVCGMMLLEAVRAYPGNKDFSRNIEITNLLEDLTTGWCYYSMTAVLIMSFHINLIASIIESSQTMDSMLGRITGYSCAIILPVNMGNHTYEPFACQHPDGSADSPFGSEYVISLGYGINMLLTVPLSRWDIDGNTFVQNACFAAMCLILLIWCVEGVFVSGMGQSIPAVGSEVSIVPGTVLFNFAFVTTLPSWCSEKHPSVKVPVVLWNATLFATFLFLLIGVVPALVWEFTDTDLLTVLTKTESVSIVSKACAYLFPIITVVSSIPIFSIVIRNNLSNGIYPPQSYWPTFWGIAFPWILAVPLYSGSMLEVIADWAGVLTTIPLNFILPAYCYLRIIRDADCAADRQLDGEELLNLDDSDEDDRDGVVVDDEEHGDRPAPMWARVFRTQESAVRAIWAFIAICVGCNVAVLSSKVVAAARG